MPLVFTVLQLFLLSVGTQGKRLALAHREMNFEDYRKGFPSSGTPLVLFRDASRTFCAGACMLYLECRSYIYCQPMVCLLYTEDAFSNIALQVDGSCDYMGMKKDVMPKCKEGLYGRNIQEDGFPNFCKINGKRVDGEWGLWNDVISIDTTDGWKKVERRTCPNNAHGGSKTCDGGKLEEKGVLLWYKFVHDKMHFDDARAKCRDMNGWLFTRVNGEKEQLDFFYEVFEDKCYWLGVRMAHRETFPNFFCPT